jgi:hypothetical protein
MGEQLTVQLLFFFPHGYLLTESGGNDRRREVQAPFIKMLHNLML